MAKTKFISYERKLDVWRHRPDLASYIADISQTWSAIEYQLALIFVILSGSNLTLGRVFSDIVPIHTRLTMLHTLVAAFLDEGDKQRYVELKGRIIKIASKRNNIVHGDWYIRNDEPDRIYLAEPFPITMAEAKPVPYTRRRFLDMLKDLTTLYNDLFAFQHHISDLNKDKPFPRSFLLR